MKNPMSGISSLLVAPHSLPPGWQWKRQQEVFTFSGGSQPPASTFKNEWEPGYVRLIQIRDYYTDSHHTFVPDSPRLRKCSDQDVMIARYGSSTRDSNNSLGRVCRGLSGAYNVALVKATPSAAIDNAFLYYLAQSEYLQSPLKGQSTRSVQAGFNKEGLKSIPLPVPPRVIQQAIAEALGALEDKIAANRRVMNQSESLRRAFWERCIIDSGEIPLSSIARFVNGKAFTKDATGSGRVVIRIAELNSGLGSSTVYNDIEVADDHIARPGDLLMAWSGSLTSARWFRPEAIVNQHIFKVIPNDPNQLWAVASAVESRMAEFQAIAATKATTMGHIQRRHLDEPVRWPELSEEVSELGTVLWRRALQAEQECEILAATRDELLPLLMSGRITVRQAEERVSQEV